SRNVAEGAHAVLLLDRAGWHTTGKLRMPANITPILLPSRAPELNPVENIWQYMRANWLSNRVFETYDVIIDAACEACENSSLNRKPSHQSGCAIGPISVSPYDPRYNLRFFATLNEHFIVGQLWKVGTLAKRPKDPSELVAATLATKLKMG